MEINCALPHLESAIAAVLDPFTVSDWPVGFGVSRGSVREYDEQEVLRRLPADSRALHRPGELIEIYERDERVWMIDDRWGMCEINILRGQWRSWVLPEPRLDAARLVEMAVLWPMAQLLKHKGIHLIPAASAARIGLGVLLLSPIDLEPELTAMLDRGYRLIGQGWTVLREEDGRFDLLHVPGRVQTRALPQPGADASDDGWEDLTIDRPMSAQMHGTCDAVLVIEAGRRPRAHLREVAQDAANLVRRAWPIPELRPQRRQGQLPARLAQRARIFQLQLSRDPRDMLALLQSIRVNIPRAKVA